jgi:hypothetical protein
MGDRRQREGGAPRRSFDSFTMPKSAQGEHQRDQACVLGCEVFEVAAAQDRTDEGPCLPALPRRPERSTLHDARRLVLGRWGARRCIPTPQSPNRRRPASTVHNEKRITNPPLHSSRLICVHVCASATTAWGPTAAWGLPLVSSTGHFPPSHAQGGEGLVAHPPGHVVTAAQGHGAPQRLCVCVFGGGVRWEGEGRRRKHYERALCCAEARRRHACVRLCVRAGACSAHADAAAHSQGVGGVGGVGEAPCRDRPCRAQEGA